MILSHATELLDLLLPMVVLWDLREGSRARIACASTCAEAGREVWRWRGVAFFEAAFDVVVACWCWCCWTGSCWEYTCGKGDACACAGGDWSCFEDT